ncbi:MAG TPA: translation initiation factor IF-3 [Candidatus Latescibacteria bacterium]|nr:translation initiation factor IF-3 [Candidatus Latescibacterota bacterium]HOF62160.1 translation initiation factor IF-3 [Candidatus Latescibacterota bacterium]HOS64606.1 translation initiation factor IF-3 [Candidatus Latescibacterota bacterium]HOT35718.1 translation initiation factor IF-3 [Candidatus Latescibacterota bacterium]HPC45467.1 translation initiation factor IF-3 [Candidatus Latescibacterota bacterium]
MAPVQKNEDRTRVNQHIRVPEVRLVGADGEQIGIVNTREALRMAEEQGYDLVEVAPNALPPVCRLMDYGKFRYEQQKKTRAITKNRGGEQKEIQMRPNIDLNDYQTKLRHAKEFLAGGDRVKLTVRFRGRELAHRDIGRDLLERFAKDLAGDGRIEGGVFEEGRNTSLNVVPSRSGGSGAAPASASPA